MSNLERLNELASCLPDQVVGELVDIAEFLKAKTDANIKSVMAWHASLPEEDEALTSEEEAELGAARAETDTISLEELRNRHGL